MASFVIVSGNIVLRKPAFQSSTHKSHSSEAFNANDGDARTNWRTDGTCSHTKYDHQAWWAVDLLRQYSVAYVTLTGWDDILGGCRSYIEGILPKGPYPPCLRMAERALVAGYPRYVCSQRLFIDICSLGQGICVYTINGSVGPDMAWCHYQKTKCWPPWIISWSFD